MPYAVTKTESTKLARRSSRWSMVFFPRMRIYGIRRDIKIYMRYETIVRLRLLVNVSGYIINNPLIRIAKKNTIASRKRIVKILAQMSNNILIDFTRITAFGDDSRGISRVKTQREMSRANPITATLERR